MPRQRVEERATTGPASSLYFRSERQGMLSSPEYGITAFTVPLFDEFMKRALPLQTAGPFDQLDA